MTCQVRELFYHLWSCQTSVLQTSFLWVQEECNPLMTWSLCFPTNFRPDRGCSILFMELHPLFRKAPEHSCWKQRALSKPLWRKEGNGVQHLACFPLHHSKMQAECWTRTGCQPQIPASVHFFVQVTVTEYSLKAIYLPLLCNTRSDPAREVTETDTPWNRFFLKLQVSHLR